MPDIIPVILCGGSGTRLWPLSRELCPKQFVDFGEKPTLFAQAMRRMQSLPGCKRAVVVCNDTASMHCTGCKPAGCKPTSFLSPSRAIRPRPLPSRPFSCGNGRKIP